MFSDTETGSSASTGGTSVTDSSNKGGDVLPRDSKVAACVDALKVAMVQEGVEIGVVLRMLDPAYDSDDGEADDMWSDDDDYNFGHELRTRAVRARRRTDNESRSTSRGVPPPGTQVAINKSLDIYLYELGSLQVELNKLLIWVKANRLKVAVIFEGRDAAGKGGCIGAISERLNPRACRVAALPAPSEREKSQWYFQRYIQHLPAAGEMVLFDRSWYNRAGVERVMGFCTDEEYAQFMRTCPMFEEEMLIRNDVVLVKYWLDIDRSVQEERFASRLSNPTKRWKLSPMDLESRTRWDAYTHARDAMFASTHTRLSPWYVVDANCKKLCRLNLIRHLLSLLPYKALPNKNLPDELPPVPSPRAASDVCNKEGDYIRAPKVYV